MTDDKPVRYLSTAEFAKRLNLAGRDSLPKNLPAPDALIGTTRGWLPETIDNWKDSRPGRGRRPRKRRHT